MAKGKSGYTFRTTGATGTHGLQPRMQSGKRHQIKRRVKIKQRGNSCSRHSFAQLEDEEKGENRQSNKQTSHSTIYATTTYGFTCTRRSMFTVARLAVAGSRQAERAVSLFGGTLALASQEHYSWRPVQLSIDAAPKQKLNMGDREQSRVSTAS